MTAVYACVSTRDKGQTNENQLRELRALSERLGYSVYQEYWDQESGAAPSGLSFSSFFSMPTSGASTWCYSGVWTASAERA